MPCVAAAAAQPGTLQSVQWLPPFLACPRGFLFSGRYPASACLHTYAIVFFLSLSRTRTSSSPPSHGQSIPFLMNLLLLFFCFFSFFLSLVVYCLFPGARQRPGGLDAVLRETRRPPPGALLRPPLLRRRRDIIPRDPPPTPSSTCPFLSPLALPVAPGGGDRIPGSGGGDGGGGCDGDRPRPGLFSGKRRRQR